MCGLVGMATRYGDAPAASINVLHSMRDRLAHRGPDAVGSLVHANIAFAHTRLAVIDLSAGGQQPMRTDDARHTLVYNGELYNDAELRAPLNRSGLQFKSACDTETILQLLATRGLESLAHLRGMFALAWHDAREQTLVLSRDPFGMKPLYYWTGTIDGNPHVIFASEVQVILAHPSVSQEPDLAAISGYFTTIRTVQGDRTLFEGVHAVQPGESIVFDLRSPSLQKKAHRQPTGSCVTQAMSDEAASSTIAAVLQDSITRHLRADVPMCSLLSGGLDSTIIASVAGGQSDGLRTYCAGCANETGDDDVAVADKIAKELCTTHTTVPIGQDLFLSRWAEMVGRLGVPLSTPNEVAINQVARQLRADGMTVALSGEGADELFAGYGGPLTLTRQFLMTNPQASVRDRAVFELEVNSWVAPSMKTDLFESSELAAIDGDEPLVAWQEQELQLCDDRANQRGDTEHLDQQLVGHLLLQRRVNLVGLLGRLDTATMLESVEGRTPFADAEVARVAEQMSLRQMIRWGDSGQPVDTKASLRAAFSGSIPSEAVSRPKASFPLPFIDWLDSARGVLDSSELLRSLFVPGVVDLVEEQPGALWRLVWPMMNIALWENAVWGKKKCPGMTPGHSWSQV